MCNSVIVYGLKFSVLTTTHRPAHNAGSASIGSIANVVGERTFHQSNSIPDAKILDNLIGLTLTNAGEVTLELNFSQLQCNPDTVLALVSYCEPTHTSTAHSTTCTDMSQSHRTIMIISTLSQQHKSSWLDIHVSAEEVSHTSYDAIDQSHD